MGFPDSWSSRWRTVLMRMKGYSAAELDSFWTNFKQQYADSMMAFVNLQGIDYNAGFRCSCSHGESLTDPRLGLTPLDSSSAHLVQQPVPCFFTSH